MKFALIGAGQLGYQLFNACTCQRLIISRKAECPPQFSAAELGYSTDLRDAAQCDIVALALPPTACQEVLEPICPVMAPGSIILNFSTKWVIPQNQKDCYPHLHLVESKLLGSAIGLSKGLKAVMVVSECTPEVLGHIRENMPKLTFEVGPWEKVSFLNARATRAAFSGLLALEKELAEEGLSKELVKSLTGCLMPGCLVSYTNGTLGHFAQEIVDELKEERCQ